MYAYDALPENSIRVAKILPGRFEDDLAVVLRARTFDPTAKSPTLPRYEALSYTWGLKDDQASINVQLGTVNSIRLLFKRERKNAQLGELEITRNLDVALRHLRHVSRSRTMWIDAICIDQSNAAEKGPQVAKMGDIYRHAERVVVWLGPEENNSDHAMRVMEEIGSQVDVDFSTHVMKPSTTARDQTLGDRNVTLPFNSTGVKSIYHLLCRPWFERLWIRQEIYLANDSAIVVCGLSSIPWQVFRRAWASIHWKSYHPFQYSYQFKERKNSILSALFQHQGALFPFLRQQLGALARCADPRDRVFALLSLDSNVDGLGIVPSYTLRAAQVYEDVAKRCMSYFLNLDVLTECEMPLGALGVKTPSWVPDWSVSSSFAISLPFLSYASGPFVCPPLHIQDHRLRVLAVPLDTIQNLHGPVIEQTEYLTYNANTRLNIKQMLSGKDLSSDYVGRGSLLEAYVRTFSLDLFAESYKPAVEDVPQFDECVQALRVLMDQDESSLPADYGANIFDRAGVVLSGRLKLETARKYIGLCPRCTLPGDEIYVVLGCRSPLILRQVGDGGYQIVGASYVAGLQDGEAFLGSKPESWRRIRVFDEAAKGGLRFVKETTGEISEDDPRLDGWSTAGLKRVPRKYPGFPVQYLVDVGDLKERGIDARYIDLV